ncbi:MAG: hypothetical protein IPK67_16510 [Planctomycetes bacterium]|nr:hypothetical protein [Planctomycetota bacterium]
MHRLQEVIRLHRMGESVRRIARQLAMGRNTIREYLGVVSTAGLLEGLPTPFPAGRARVPGARARGRWRGHRLHGRHLAR